jgi:membrane-bound lytic murein transglycosylase D
MRCKLQAVGAVILLAGTIGLAAGCEDAGKKPVQAKVPARGHALAAAASAVPQTPPELPPLPLHSAATRPLPVLTPHVPGGKEYLIARVEEKFASGQQNYKAGHLEAARKDFDDAVDWMLESGYDPNSDPKLSELFHRVVDTVYTYELQAFRAGDGFQEAPAVPAPIDEVAEMTFPVDPRLKERAEAAAKNISHDLPLTVNDEVLSFLNFFQTPRGRAIVETGLRRAGRYREMIARVLHEEGVPHDLIYLAQAESAFQPLAPRPSTCATCTASSATGIWPWPRTTAVRATCKKASSALATPISGNCTSATCCRAKPKTTYRSSWP